MKTTNCDDEVLESGVPSHEDDAEVARLAAALGHPARVAILRLLKQRQVCICGEIVEQLPLAQSTVSQHLKVLKDAGWIQAEGDGTRVCYEIKSDVAERFATLIRDL